MISVALSIDGSDVLQFFVDHSSWLSLDVLLVEDKHK